MKLLKVALILVIILMPLNVLAYDYDEEVVIKKQVEDILGFSVFISNFKIAKNLINFDFDITSEKFKGKISFSKNYIEEDYNSAKKDLLAIYELKIKFPKLERIALRYLNNEISRYVSIGYSKVFIADDWKTVILEGGIEVIEAEKCGYLNSFYLPYPSDKLDNEMVDYLDKIYNGSFQYSIKTLWGLQIDTFIFEGESFWVLKGSKSTIFYYPKNDKFMLGGLWEESAEIKGVNPKNRTILIKENCSYWILKIIDTNTNKTCSAYSANDVNE